MYCVIMLQAHKRKLIVPQSWVLHSKRYKPAKIFFSENQSAQPNFDLRTCYFLQKEDACYNGYCLKECGKPFFILTSLLYS